jgi:hypothetical protein
MALATGMRAVHTAQQGAAMSGICSCRLHVSAAKQASEIHVPMSVRLAVAGEAGAQECAVGQVPAATGPQPLPLPHMLPLHMLFACEGVHSWALAEHFYLYMTPTPPLPLHTYKLCRAASPESWQGSVHEADQPAAHCMPGVTSKRRTSSCQPSQRQRKECH